MKSLFISIILLILVVQVSSAQNQNLVQKLDKTDLIYPENFQNQFQIYLDDLHKNKNSKGYIIIYRSDKEPIGYTTRLATEISKYIEYLTSLFNTSENFEIINGGTKTETLVELWIGNSESKTPISNFREKINPNELILFDSFSYPSSQNGVEMCCVVDGFLDEEDNASFEHFAKILKENNNLQGYLIYYGQYCKDCSQGEILFDSAKTNRRILQKEKNNLIKNYKIDASRIVAVNGGYRDWRVFELWLAPKGEKTPKPTPTMFPRKRVQRKNK